MNKSLFYGNELVERIEVWRCWRAMLERPARRIALTQAQVDSLVAINALRTRKGVDDSGHFRWLMYMGDMQVVVQTVDQFAAAGVAL